MITLVVKSEFTYIRQLVAAGWDGARSARHAAEGRHTARVPALRLLAPALLGAGIGALSAALGTRRSRRSMTLAAVAGGIAGGVAGLGAATAWASRDSANAAARAALHQINAVRDTHWLEKNPVAYA